MIYVKHLIRNDPTIKKRLGIVFKKVYVSIIQSGTIATFR